ncbi:hypothetical protein ACFYY2_01285 [Streptomyces sp. NPDC001822]|uniref:hypothetical protein n=1 Tax=Streptomyces sp. NPDC001822 TaxID=3364614 RepID=UPI0036B9B8B1
MLGNRTYRAYEASALRSLFSTLKAERLIFADPMRGIKGGKVPIKIPASLAADEVESVVLAALQDPALRVVVALSGMHALPARQIRSMLVELVDLPGRRLDPEDLDVPLATTPPRRSASTSPIATGDGPAAPTHIC